MPPKNGNPEVWPAMKIVRHMHFWNVIKDNDIMGVAM